MLTGSKKAFLSEFNKPVNFMLERISFDKKKNISKITHNKFVSI